MATTEYNIAHMRCMSVRVAKGDYLQPEEVDWLQEQRSYLDTIISSIDEMLALQKEREDAL